MNDLIKKDKVIKASILILIFLVIIFFAAIIFVDRRINNEAQPLSIILEEGEVFGDLEKAIINISGKHVTASVANSDLSRKKGLGGVKSINVNEGKLLVFDTLDFHSIWMKDMNFSIDAIFMDDLGVVVDIIEGIHPDTYPNTFTSTKPSSQILEVNAGWVMSNDVKIGDVMILTKLK